MIVSEEHAGRLAARLLAMYCELGEKGRVSKATMAASIGVSRTYWSQLLKQECPPMKAYTFLSLVQAIDVLRTGFDEGWLPAAAKKGEPQEYIAARLSVASE